ncbi:MAG: hypothetical protein M1319_02025 [Chloroflexi bacterium]|nr:hypothetical protein [Chloroflexota bacterium]
MSTRADLRARIRQELGDETAGAYVWSEALLNAYIASAIRRCGLDLPKESMMEISLVAGQRYYTLPDDCRQVAAVEYPEGVFLRRDPVAGGDRLFAGGGEDEDAWEQYGGALWLRRTPPVNGEVVKLRYLGSYLCPGDDVTTLDLPAQDEDLVVWLVCEAALSWLNKQKDKRLERRGGYLYSSFYASRYQEGLRSRRRLRGVVSRRMG